MVNQLCLEIRENIINHKIIKNFDKNYSIKNIKNKYLDYIKSLFQFNILKKIIF